MVYIVWTTKLKSSAYWECFEVVVLKSEGWNHACCRGDGCHSCPIVGFPTYDNDIKVRNNTSTQRTLYLEVQPCLTQLSQHWFRDPVEITIGQIMPVGRNERKKWWVPRARKYHWDNWRLSFLWYHLRRFVITDIFTKLISWT